VYPPRDEHHEHPVAARDRSLYDLAVVGCARHDLDPILELGELSDALFPAHADDVVPTIQRVLDHVLPELSGGPNDADPHRMLIQCVLSRRWERMIGSFPVPHRPTPCDVP
jgi:hypothetical protein